jgi:hypothetical protein
MKLRVSTIVVIFLLVFSFPITAFAQDYSFSVDQNVVHVLWNDDGTVSIAYSMVFTNETNGHIIDFVDLGLPSYSFNESEIQAEINGNPVSYISSSEFQGTGSGVAIALGSFSIPPGSSGTLTVWIPEVQNNLFIDDTDSSYASAVFAPAWFDSRSVHGSTDLTVTFHLPPGVQPDEPRWHKAPDAFSEEPETGLDQEGRITYTWNNPDANSYTKYEFGASFPSTFVPSANVVKPTVYDRTGISQDTIMGFLCCGSVGAFIVFLGWIGVVSDRRRKMKYLPPKMKIEGHGIKRGLTAIEAAILMEQPMDKILTMILFSVIKKDAASVINKDPLKIKVTDPLPEDLRPYEVKFLNAFDTNNSKERQRTLQKMMVELIKSVGNKMQGFSHKETVAYYKNIMERAWNQVETADTPEVKSQKFDENIGWTMLEKDFNDRTEEVFRTGPVFVPIWWGRYDPTWTHSTSSTPRVSSSRPSSGGKITPSLPTLPGGQFAASVVTGIQGFSSNVVGNLTDFTSRVTKTTNPVPKTTSRSGGFHSGGGGSSCACACACAGCACACAGGGR